MTDFLTKAEIEAMPPVWQAIYAKERQIAAIEEAKLALAMRLIPGAPDAADLEDAIGELEIELGPLRAEFTELVKAGNIVTPITVDEIEELRRTISAMSAVIAANKAVGELLDSARAVVNHFA